MSKNGWTQERRLKQSEAIKRWKPWEKSTGAKTKEGKEKSKMNAQKHSSYSAEMKKLHRFIHEHDNFLTELN